MKALPCTYCCWRGATVVHSTGRLTNHSGNLKPFMRRLMETSKFLINVLSPGGIEANGLGHRAAVKVRTLHAFIRFFIKKREWDVEKLGEPINQEDMAGTMFAFSVFVIEGLEQIGIRVSKDEKEAYYHIWRVVGHMLGLEDKMIPKTYDDAQKLGHIILNDQKGHSPEGEELAQTVIDFLQMMTPYSFLRFVPQNMMYFFMGKELSGMVGIKKSRRWIVNAVMYLFIKILLVVEWLKHKVPFIQRWALKMNTKILNRLIIKFLKESGSPFTPKIIQGESKLVNHNKK